MGCGFDAGPGRCPARAGSRERACARSPVPDLDPATRSHLLHLYGSLAEEVLEPALLEPRLLEPLHPGGPDVAAQIGYAVEQEWAVRVEDVLCRRTTLGYRGLADAAAAQVAEALGYPAALGSA